LNKEILLSKLCITILNDYTYAGLLTMKNDEKRLKSDLKNQKQYNILTVKN